MNGEETVERRILKRQRETSRERERHMRDEYKKSREKTGKGIDK